MIVSDNRKIVDILHLNNGHRWKENEEIIAQIFSALIRIEMLEIIRSYQRQIAI